MMNLQRFVWELDDLKFVKQRPPVIGTKLLLSDATFLSSVQYVKVHLSICVSRGNPHQILHVSVWLC